MMIDKNGTENWMKSEDEKIEREKKGEGEKKKRDKGERKKRDKGEKLLKQQRDWKKRK